MVYFCVLQSRLLEPISSGQGDQIGLFFAYRAIHYFGQIFKVAQFFAAFSMEKLCVSFDKNRLGSILLDFFHKLIWSPCLRLRCN
jgi:hypothetical protein